MNALLFVLPYVLAAVVGGVLGFMFRNGSFDRIMAENVNLRAELDGREIRTSRAPEAPVQRSAPSTRTRRPVLAPEAVQARTAPLPANVRYVPFPSTDPGTDDTVLTDEEYREMFRND